MKYWNKWAVILCAAVMLVFVGFSGGCGSLDPEGAYKGDKVLYSADRTITEAYDAMHAFVKWEFQNRAALAENPEITKAADSIRSGAQKWITSAIALRDAYAAAPTSENNQRLQTALSILKQAIAEAAGYMAAPPPKKKAEFQPSFRFASINALNTI